MERGSFTTVRELLSLLTSPERKRINRGDPGEKRRFTAIAVFDSVPLNGESMQLFIGNTTERIRSAGVSDTIENRRAYANAPFHLSSTSDEIGDLKRYSVVCKIVADANGKRFRSYANIHNFIGRCGSDLRLDHLYLKCITSSNDFRTSTYITEGDHLLIECEYDRYGKLNQERGRVVKIMKKVGRLASNGIRCTESEEDLSLLF